MSAPYVTRPTAARQLQAVHQNLDVADRSRMAHFITDTVKIWGIDEKCAGPNRDDLVTAELTVIITLNDRRNRLNRDDMKAVARRELENFIADSGAGHWSEGRLPKIFDYTDLELVDYEAWMMSRSTWVAHMTVEARYEDPGLPAGHYEYWSERGV